MSFISLLTGKLHKKKLKKSLKIFPKATTIGFYRDLADDVDSAVRSDFYGRIVIDVDIPSDDIQKYILRYA